MAGRVGVIVGFFLTGDEALGVALTGGDVENRAGTVEVIDMDLSCRIVMG